jgi:hypothetical protein
MNRSMPWVLSEIVSPALLKIMPDDPISLVRLARHPSPFVGPYADENAAPLAVQIEVEVAGEVFVDIAYDPATMPSGADARNRLASNLADFVAESRFGWGQKRD